MSGLEAILNRPRPSWISLFLQSPLKTQAKTLFSWRILEQRPQSDALTLVCTSDTHNSQPLLPDGDLLIHAGDLTQTGTFSEIQQTLDWLNRQTHEHVVVIAGNHDLLLDASYTSSPREERERESLNWGRIIYLEDATKTLDFSHGRSLNIYGSPWTRKHGNWAFQYPASQSMAEQHFSRIPTSTDVLVTHMPPRFYLDVDGWGDEALLRHLKRVRPLVHVFGHVHEGYGQCNLQFDGFESRYEDVCRGNQGFWGLLMMAWSLMLIRCNSGGRAPGQSTRLVNPSAVGGLKDDNERIPLVVRI